MKNLITLTVNSTHFYLIDCIGGKLLVDAGWTLPQFTNQLQSFRVAYSDIKYVMFTHHHPDHAGLVQDVKNQSRARLIIHEKQIPFLKNLKAYYEKKGGYEPIQIARNDLVSPSRADLFAIGIDGEMIETPGHSEDSISLVLDSGDAFIGDLTAPDMVSEDQKALVYESWKKLLAHNVRMFYHGHTDPIPAETVRALLPNA